MMQFNPANAISEQIDTSKGGFESYEAIAENAAGSPISPVA